MKQLERYLNHATRGTYGKTRVLIRAELEANIRMRGKELEHHGLNETQAITRALEELGAPNFVSAGMTRVYTMPKIALATVPLAATIGIFVAVLSSSLAKISFTNTGPIPTCPPRTLKQTEFCLMNPIGFSWLEISSLIAELRAKGVKVTENGKYVQSLKGSFTPGSVVKYTDLPAPQLEITFPQDHKILFDKPLRSGFSSWGFAFGESVPFTDDQKKAFWNRRNQLAQDVVAFRRNNKTYLSSHVFLDFMVAKSQLPVSLDGWENPQLQVGQTKISLGSSETPVIFLDAFKEALTAGLITAKYRVIVGWGYNHSEPSQTGNIVYPHRVHVNASDNTAYAILHSSRSGLMIDLVPVQNGMLEFNSPRKILKFTTNLKALDNSNDTKSIVSIVRLTGRLNSPKQAFTTELPKEKISHSR